MDEDKIAAICPLLSNMVINKGPGVNIAGVVGSSITPQVIPALCLLKRCAWFTNTGDCAVKVIAISVCEIAFKGED